jgi:hypothetical protein
MEESYAAGGLGPGKESWACIVINSDGVKLFPIYWISKEM